MTAEKKSDAGCLVWAAAIGTPLLLISMCSSSKSTSDADTAPQAATSLNSTADVAVTPEAPKPVEPFSPGEARKGLSEFRLVYSAERLSGAMIYSQNCYDALTREFSWSKLDRCGAADMAAVNALMKADTEGLTSEVAYFDSETAAQRYLTAAIKAGEPAEEADQRLSALQSRVPAQAAPAEETAPVPVAPDEEEGDEPTEVDESEPALQGPAG